MVLADAGSTRLASVLREQTRPNTKHATQQHIATSIRKAERSQTQLQRLRTASISTFSSAEPRCSHRSFTASRGGAARSPPSPSSLRRGSYLKLAGEFTWMLRPDGGLAFLFSLSAMPPSYMSSIGSAVRPLSRDT